MISTDSLSEILSSCFNQVLSSDLNIKLGSMESHGQYDAPHKPCEHGRGGGNQMSILPHKPYLVKLSTKGGGVRDKND